MPSATGTAITSAMVEVRTVPNAIAAMPKRGGVSLAYHSWYVKKFSAFSRSDGIAWTIRKIAMATMMTRTIEPAEVATARKIRSAPNRWPLGRPPPPPETGVLAGAVGVIGGAATVDQARLLTDVATFVWSSAGSGAYPMSASLAWPSLLDV